MANQFQEVIVTTKTHQNCNQCYKRLTTGTQALAHFYRNHGETQSIWICDTNCLLDYRDSESKGSDDAFLDSLSVIH